MFDRKALISELSMLDLKRKSIIRSLDIYYKDKSTRNALFLEKKIIEDKIAFIKFKLSLLKEFDKYD